jgi:acyl-CoA synthetase (AMP-forming)/AMP-acid ligase II
VSSPLAIDWLARRAQLSPERIALIDGERGGRTTYRQWNASAERAAGALAHAGVGQGDRVAVLAENAPAVLDLLFACGKLGAVFMPLNWRLSDPELDRQLEHARPAALLTDGAMASRAPGQATKPVLALDEQGGAQPALESYLAARLARYKLPRRYELVPELPGTGAGKLDRAALRRRAETSASARSA